MKNGIQILGNRSGETDRRYFGKYPAVVKENKPAEGAHRGVLLVEIPGLLEEEPGSDSAGGASGAGEPKDRPMQVNALPCLPPGFFFVPEVGQQVWVEFAAGDINQPLWSGVWYPADKPPKTAKNSETESASPSQDQKIIRTASGQVINLDDTEGSERIVIADEKNGNAVTINQSGIKIEDANGNVITLDKNGVKVTSCKDLQIEDASGNSIKLSSSGIVCQGNIGSADNVALKRFVDELLNWLLGHKHVGNMGAPTPLFPDNIATLSVLQGQIAAPGSGYVSADVKLS